jgi:diguanylate cyclase (GGDEF)-like protein
VVKRVREWAVWQLRPAALGLVLAVDALAAALFLCAIASSQITAKDLTVLGGLIVTSLTVGEVCRNAERKQERHVGLPLWDSLTVWLMAGALLLPTSLAMFLVVIHVVVFNLRVRSFALFKITFNIATDGLSVLAAKAIHESLLGSGTASTTGSGLEANNLRALAATVVAGLIFITINSGLVTVAIRLASPNIPLDEAIGGLRGHLMEAASAALGALIAMAATINPLTILLGAPVTAIMWLALLHGERLTNVSRTDTKTGLATEAHWRELAHRELARAEREQRPLSIVMIDIDRFKDVNDTYGHLAGDAVLQEAAAAMTEHLRDYDVAGRFGGDEFVLLLPTADETRIAQLVERVTGRLAAVRTRTIRNGGRPETLTPLSVSAGVSSYPANGHQVDSLLLAADQALYDAKAGGRSQLRFASRSSTPMPTGALNHGWYEGGESLPSYH